MKYWTPFLGYVIGTVLFNVIAWEPMAVTVPRMLHLFLGAGSMTLIFWLQNEFR